MPARIEGKPQILSAAFVKTISKPGRYGDGRGSFGLFLYVWRMSNGRIGKNWGQRIQINGRHTNLGLGPVALLTLAEAREKARQNAKAIASGVDPQKSSRRLRRVVQTSVSPTFAAAVERVVDIHRDHWKDPRTATAFQSTLKTYAFPALETRAVGEITSQDVMAVLEPIWTDKPEVSRKVRKNIGKVMKWATAQGFRSDNPAGDVITQALPKHGRCENYESLPFSEVRAAIEKIRNSGAWHSARLCLEFLVLTAARSGEARQATWEEIDLEAATWTVPRGKTKNSLEHRVPLSKQALSVLAEAQRLNEETGNGKTGLVFPSQGGKVQDGKNLTNLLSRNEIACVVHGFRTSFRVWAAECTDVPREISEYALNHREGSQSELAYRRTDYFERRAGLMQDWADYLGI